MKPNPLKNLILALLPSLLLFFCTSSGGIGGSGLIMRGSITEFGSIIVNGAEIDISNAVIIADGEIKGVGDDVALENLDIGRIVTVKGTGSEDNDDIVAEQVKYNDDVEGPVESIQNIDSNTKKIVVLNQTVIVNALTKFKGITFDTIAEGDVVEVSGLNDNTGAIWATFVEKTGEFKPGLVVEVNGVVKNLKSESRTFEINNLTVDYSIADTSALPLGVPTEGLFVEVEGTLDASGGEMMATEIEPEDEIGSNDADEIEITGFVTDFVSGSAFTVGSQAVQTDENTEYVDGEPGDIAPGVKLEVEGSLVNGILFAEEVEFWEPDQLEVEGVVTDIVSVSEFTVGDQVVQTHAGTVFEGGTTDDIALGVLLEVKGVPIDIEHTVLLADKVSFEQE